MNDKEKNIINRYLYDVIRRLPDKQKKDIEQELNTLIEDMLEERQDNGKPFLDNIKDVLEELGEPALLAAKYRGSGECLIGSNYYVTYCQVLKIVLWCVGLSLLVSVIVSFFMTRGVLYSNGLISTVRETMLDFAEIPGILLQIFGSVTLIFVIMERNQVKMDANKEKWSIDKLPPVPYEKAVIKRGDSLAGIIFGIVFMALLIWVPEIMGAYLKTDSGEYVSIALFNMAIWKQVLPLFLISLGLGVAEDICKLITGAYTMTVMWFTVITSLISMALTIAIFWFHDIWNPNFATAILQAAGRDYFGEFDLLAYWSTENLTYILSAIILLSILVNIAVTVYKTVRYVILDNQMHR